jgi:hypothetical protein
MHGMIWQLGIGPTHHLMQPSNEGIDSWGQVKVEAPIGHERYVLLH